jgi:endoribonuclease Dicer
MPSKIWAKRFAAFELAVKLREDLELDGWLKPVYEPNKRHVMANAILSLNSKKGKGYKYKKKAVFWTPNPEAPDPVELWATVITIKDTGVLGFGYQPYVILTRKKMPCIPSFELFFDMGPSNIIFTRLAKPIRMADYPGMMGDLNEFTTRTFHHVFNKKFKFTTKVTPYWIGPILSAGSSDITEGSDFNQIFDWKQFNYAAKNELAPNNFHEITTDEEANGKVMMEIRNFSRRFVSLRLAPHLKPTDPCPEGTPGHTKFNIFEYTVFLDSKKKESPYVAGLREKKDIVIEAERIAQWFPLTYNAPRDSKNLKKTAYVTTVPFHISPVRIPHPL